jgi:hypothetical protein
LLPIEQDWVAIMASFGKRQDAQKEQLDQLVSGGSLRNALAFGALGLLAALVLAPALDNRPVSLATISDDDLPIGIDRTVTGSVRPAADPVVEPPQGTLRYTIRRSVVQSDPSEPCYIYEDGTSHGGC